MKKIFSTSLIFLVCSFTFAQAPDTLWTKTYGDSSYDFGSSIIQTNINSFIISGSIGTQLSGNSHTSDIWLFGIDEVGTELWSHNYGGMGGGDIVNANNDEFFIAAEAFNQGSWEDMQILKVNQVGDTLWTKTSSYSQHEYKPQIEKTSDGGLIILGFTYGFPTGTLLIKINEFGDTLWTKFFSVDTYQLRSYSPQIDNDGAILFLAQIFDSTFIYKTDSLGNLIWKNKVCSAPYSMYELLLTEEGNFLMVGSYHPSYDSSFISIFCVDNNFNTIWSHTYFSPAKVSYPTNVIKSNTEGYLIIGSESVESYSPTDGTILKINDSGQLIWRKSYGGPSSEYFNDILILDDNEFLVVGTTASFGAGENDAWVLKFTADTATSAVKNDDNSKLPQGYTLNQNYPNPFNPSTKIEFRIADCGFVTLKVYDILGNEIATLVNEEKQPGTYEAEFSAKGESASGGNAYNLPSGVYIYSLRAGSFAQTRKMILLK